MREQLTQYVELLFAGAQNCEDVKQEILQNTLDRYDDLIAEGKVPEAAYRLAITGIGDVNEILGTSPKSTAEAYVSPADAKDRKQDTVAGRLLRAIAIGLYILSPLPLFVLSEMGMATIGLCGLLCIVAVATVLMVLGAKRNSGDEEQEEEKHRPLTPAQELRGAVKKLIDVLGLVLYLIVSFTTGAWFITWLIFPIMGAVRGLVNAILDLKEAVDHEI